MITITNIRIFANRQLDNRDIYLSIKTADNQRFSKVRKIVAGHAEWDLRKEAIELTQKEHQHVILAELWDYEQCRNIGKHSIIRFNVGSEENNKWTYNGFFIGHADEEIKISIDYGLVDKECKHLERIKGKQTKRTDYTNRESNNSLNNLIQQPSSISKLYASLIHSISERNIGDYKQKISNMEFKSPQKISSAKMSQFLNKKSRPIV